MYIPFPVNDNVIISNGANRCVFTNYHAEKDIIIRLPVIQTSKTFEVLLLNSFKVTLHANSETTKFLAEPKTLKLTVGGHPSCVGRSLSIVAYEAVWRLHQSNIPEPYIVFED